VQKSGDVLPVTNEDYAYKSDREFCSTVTSAHMRNRKSGLRTRAYRQVDSALNRVFKGYKKVEI
jgi:hypothetical protein